MLCPIKVDLMRGEKPLVKLPADAWIAGGCCRRWFTGEPQDSDIDVFCKDAGVAGGVVSMNGLEEPGWKKFDSKMATTYRHDRRVIQIIKQPFDSLEAVLDWFDYTICQFGMGSDDQPMATPEALVCACRKHLAVANIHPEYAVDSLRRAFKYAAIGYKPCLGTLRDIAKSMSTVTPEQIEQQVQVSPNGGRRLGVQFD